MAPKIKIVQFEKYLLGEGPHWDHEAKVLYFVDIVESTVLKYDPSTTKITSVIVDKQNKTSTSWVIPVSGSKDKFVIGYGNEIAVMTWNGISAEPTKVEIIVAVDTEPDVEFNDGKADPSGRLWGGTMAKYVEGGPEQRKGAFYSLSNDGKSVKSHFGDVGISNGLAWSGDQKTFYYIDSFNRTIDAFDFDIDNETISNRRVAFDLAKNDIGGLPDGMTTDKDGNIWVAVFGTSSVFQVDPNDSSILQTVKFPAPFVTSCAWGGPNLDELYVTSASMFDKEGSHYAGRLFRVTGLGTSGFPGVAVKL